MNKVLTVAETIKMLEATIAELQLRDPDAIVVGHIAYPKGGYSGDLDGSIFEVEVEDGDEEGTNVVLGVHYY